MFTKIPNLFVKFVCLTVLMLPASVLIAQEENDQGQTVSANDEIEEVKVVGSRRLDRSAADSPVPVDVLQADEFLAQGGNDMDDLLAALVPSYNVSLEPISDAATFIRPAVLRSLSPDSTLVLVNGKRRHRAAVIALLGAGAAGGAQAPDLSVIPAVALDRVEVLRDGASSQYGSDAIAGIMNFVLKEASDGFLLDIKTGQYFEGDGAQVSVASYIGFPLSDVGFATFAAEWKEQDATSRSSQRTDAQDLIDAGNTDVRQPAAQIWGSPDIYDDFKIWGNVGVDVGDNNEAYAFGNWAEREVVGGFYYRNPHTRNGVFRGDVVDGFNTVKVADLTGDMSGNCPVVRIVDHVADPDALAAIQNDPNCYSLIEKFPGGFTPNFGGQIADLSLVGGLRGTMNNGWYFDLSASIGRSYALFYIFNTINPQLLSLRNNIPTHYESGAYTETDRVFNVDMAKPIELDNGLVVNFAWGYEQRQDSFRISNGEPNSYFIDPNLAAQGFGIGSNGFPGFPPTDAGINSVDSTAFYVDLESDVSENFLLAGALRYENYPDYGDTLDGKLAARIEINPTTAIRGAVSTGFRVPTAGQANLRNVTTEFDMGMLADIATLPPTNAIAIQKGAQALTPEKSVNTTFGFIGSVANISVTVDWYNIEVKDRIAFTSRFHLTDADIEALLAEGVADASSFSSVRFLSNQQTLRTSGIDVVATTQVEFGGGVSSFAVAANFNDVELSKFNPDFTSENRKNQIEDGQPATRITATWNHRVNQINAMVRLRYYGEYYDTPTNDAAAAYRPDPVAIWDAEISFHMNDRTTITGGMQNMTDVYPTVNPNGNIAGLLYGEQSPYGFNGGYIYGRITWQR
ncbi:MAG: TonB-dependent receptor [Gammaproteobacteria bacterium]|nr:TonB-dependent receptor [Gammaproteobacteria bacterium]MYF01509.1 TonB-dependent receptor [Gammaproteobacteria bacterium]MYI77561.1 TonB-dependent receptor [Gammaproteobacteria bacterium]